MLCYKTQGNYAVFNELPSGTVGWVVVRGTVGLGNFCSSSFLSFFPLFPFLGLGFSVRLSVRLRVRIVLRFRF